MSGKSSENNGTVAQLVELWTENPGAQVQFLSVLPLIVNDNPDRRCLTWR